MSDITVIVPVYNAAQTLDACVQSLLEQSLTDFEILLINDGSTDDSGARCDAWRVRDARVRTAHQENGGVQSAVLHGIAQARSAHCAFVDSDDTVKPELLAALWKGAQETQADIVCCGFVDVDANGAQTIAWAREKKLCYDAPQIAQALDSFFLQEASLTSFCAEQRWNKLYRTQLLRDIVPLLDPTQALGEDIVMNLYALSRCKKLAVVPYVGYCYTAQSASATRSMSQKKYGQYCQMMQCLQQTATVLRRDGAALQARQDALFSALILQTLLSALPLWNMHCIICALRAKIQNREVLKNFAHTQPLHGKLALQSIAVGLVLPMAAIAFFVQRRHGKC